MVSKVHIYFRMLQNNNWVSIFKARLAALQKSHNDVLTFIRSPFFYHFAEGQILHVCLYFFFLFIAFSLATHHSVSMLPFGARIVITNTVICMYFAAHAHTLVPSIYCVIIAQFACLSVNLYQRSFSFCFRIVLYVIRQAGIMTKAALFLV